MAKAAGYTGAGTVEFLVEGSGDDARFYFLEVNARLQVEHPITETVAGVDLVHAQLRVAAGEPLPWTQEQLAQRGHAIEVRLYAEDPARGYLPQAGRVALYREPSMPGVRVDAGVTEGSDVSVHYDPLLAKLIAWGETRDVARRRALAALNAFPILGLRTNHSLLRRILEHPRFARGDLDTHFLEREHDALTEQLAPDDAHAVRRAGRGSSRRATARAAGRVWSRHPGPMGSRGPLSWLSLPSPPWATAATWWTWEAHATWPTVSGRARRCGCSWTAGSSSSIRAGTPAPSAAIEDDAALSAPMPARVLAIMVEPGQRVAKGDVLVTLEAMKMELPVRAPRDGTVTAVSCQTGRMVNAGDHLVELE